MCDDSVNVFSSHMKGGRDMKVVYPICCGVDVHKTFLVATIITSQGITPSYSKKRFSTFNNSILQFKQWLIENNCFDVCMESTGKYWVPIHNLFSKTNCSQFIHDPQGSLRTLEGERRTLLLKIEFYIDSITKDNYLT